MVNSIKSAFPVMVASVLTGQCVDRNTAKTNTLRCVTLVINRNLNMMGYFDFFISFRCKILALKSTLINFVGNASTSRYPARHTNIGIDI